jgi:hypothetical protein
VACIRDLGFCRKPAIAVDALITFCSVQAHDYRDLIASYVETNFGGKGLMVYTEVSLGKTIIGKNRKLDILILRKADQRSLALECKYQRVSGTADEKIPYALQDLDAMWIPGCLVYGGEGWSQGVLHTLEGSRLAVFCLPQSPELSRSASTIELDHVLAAVFGLWDFVIPETRKFARQLSLPLKGPKKVEPVATPQKTSSGEEDK